MNNIQKYPEWRFGHIMQCWNLAVQFSNVCDVESGLMSQVLSEMKYGRDDQCHGYASLA